MLERLLESLQAKATRKKSLSGRDSVFTRCAVVHPASRLLPRKRPARCDHQKTRSERMSFLPASLRVASRCIVSIHRARFAHSYAQAQKKVSTSLSRSETIDKLHVMPDATAQIIDGTAIAKCVPSSQHRSLTHENFFIFATLDLAYELPIAVSGASVTKSRRTSAPSAPNFRASSPT